MLKFIPNANYQIGTIKEILKECLPNGAEMFFDNVGGKMSSDIINHGMKEGGRIVVCGSISYYNDEEPPLCPATSLTFIVKVNEYDFMKKKINSIHQKITDFENGRLDILALYSKME